MKRNLISWIITLSVVLICVYLLPMQAQAASTSDLTFSINSGGASYCVSDCASPASGDLVIPATYNGKPVTTIGTWAFENCTSLTSITIPDSITSIGFEAFRNCSNLTSITIPDSITSIGNSAFYNCTDLKKVYISDLKAWCEISFANSASNPLYEAGQLYLNNTLVTDVVIPNSVLSIGNYAFNNYTNLTSVIIPDGVTSIGNYAFNNCTSLTSITIPNSVINVGNYAFFACKSLTNIVIPNSHANLGSQVFSECTSLKSVTIPGGDNYTHTYETFGNCNIEKQTFSEGTTVIRPEWVSPTVKEIVIPDSVIQINPNTFSHCENLTDVYISDPNAWVRISGLKYLTNYVNAVLHIVDHTGTKVTQVVLDDYVHNIPDRAFKNCTSLTSITIPDSVTSIGNVAFSGCTSLSSISIPNSVTSVGSSAFSGCTSLTSITIPSVNRINMGTFYGCTNLTYIAIPNSVTSIGSQAFSGCTNLWHVLYKGTAAQWNNIAVDATNKLLTEATRHYECTGNEVNPINKTCSICLFANCTHTYDNACDGECNICGSTRTIPHNYQGAWSKDDTSHWYECSVCGNKKDLAAHTPGTAATESAAQTCTICGYIITPALNHTHKYSDTLSSDRDGHWYACTGCSEKKNYAAHVYTDVCDADCNVCGYARSVAHNYKNTWSKDGTSHWIECSVCVDKKDLAAHTPGTEATETTPQTCTICGYIIKPALNHTHSFATAWVTDDAGHWHTCSGCEEKVGYADHSWSNGCCSICGTINPNTTQPSETPTENQKPTNAPDDQTATPTKPTDGKEGKGGIRILLILILGVAIGVGGAVGSIYISKKHQRKKQSHLS